MPFSTFKQSSFNFTFARADFVFPSGHADRYAKVRDIRNNPLKRGHKLVRKVAQKEIVDLLNKCWMTHDGMWFFHCLQEFGIEATNKINKAAIKSLSSIETKRIKKALGIENKIETYNDFKVFFKEASKIMIPDCNYSPLSA